MTCDGKIRAFDEDDLKGSLPTFVVKVAIHFIGPNNFYDGDVNDWDVMNGTTQAIAMIDHANLILGSLHDNPVQVEDYLGDSRIRVQIEPDYETGVYFWEKEEDYQPVDGVLNVLSFSYYRHKGREVASGEACGIGLDCNWVKMWGWQSENRKQNKSLAYRYARLFLHELGHVLGLSHSYSSYGTCVGIDIDASAEAGRWNSGSYNMMNEVDCQCALSPCQWRHIYTNLYNGNYSFAEVDCGYQPADIVVTQDEVWEDRVVATGNIVVMDGVNLVVKCTVELNTDSRIIVRPNARLIVDGGVLTVLQHCDVASWRGIKVYGGNSDFDVKITNGSVVEHTSEAAVSMFAPEPWPNATNYGNGILHADNSVFNDTRRIAELMAWTPQPNGSYVINCVQNGGKWGLTNWNCQGVKVLNNTFNDISHYGIVTINGEFEIKNNVFNSGDIDIYLYYPTVATSSVIKDNTFNGLTGYLEFGSTIDETKIESNDFNCSWEGIYTEGETKYKACENNFDCGICIFTQNAGGDPIYNKITVCHNSFTGFHGMQLEGYNDGFNFYENCFNIEPFSGAKDVYVHGTVAPIIHNDKGCAANNCFTHRGHLGVAEDFVGIFWEEVYYYEPYDFLTDCRDLIYSPDEVKVVRVGCGGETIPNHCQCNEYQSSDTTTSELGLSKYFPNGEDVQTLLLQMQELEQELKAVRNDPSLDEQTRIIQEHVYKTAIVRYKMYIAELYVKMGDYNAMRALFTGDTSDYVKFLIYSSYILQGDLNAAQAYLQTIVPNSQSMADLLSIQDIYLNFCRYGRFYQPSQSDLNRVLNVAMKDHSRAAYAKALYFALTGELLRTPSNLISELRKARRSSMQVRERVVDVLPNPFNNNLQVRIENCTQCTITIRNVYGEIYYERMITDDARLSIDTKDWNVGLYLIEVEEKNTGWRYIERGVLLR